MGIYFNKETLKANTAEGRIMRAQYAELQAMRQNGAAAHAEMIRLHNEFNANGIQSAFNVARTPAEAFREFDDKTTIDKVPAGEYATLTRLLGGAKSVDLGRKLYEYRQATDMEEGQSSMSGTIGVKSDKLDYTYDGTIVPIHDKGFHIDYRDYLAMKAEGFDALVDYSREAERGIMRTMDNYLFDGNASLVFRGRSWLGLRNDPSVVQHSLGQNLTTATPQQVSEAVSAAADALWITNNTAKPLKLGVSREIMSYWERTPYSVDDATFGNILTFIKNLRYFEEIYEDSELTGNQIIMYWDDQQGFHAVSGMAMSTYALPRQFHNSPFAYTKWTALGFMAKTDAENRRNVLYGS
jgi:hypothetical protein